MMYHVCCTSANPQSEDNGAEKHEKTEFLTYLKGGSAAGTEGGILIHEQTSMYLDYNPGTPMKMMTTSGEGKWLPGRLTSLEHVRDLLGLPEQAGMN